MGKLDHLFSDAMNHLERVSNNDIPPCDVMTVLKNLTRNCVDLTMAILLLSGHVQEWGKPHFSYLVPSIMLELECLSCSIHLT